MLLYGKNIHLGIFGKSRGLERAAEDPTREICEREEGERGRGDIEVAGE